MKEVLTVVINNEKIMLYENFFSFVNNNEGKINIKSREIINITNELLVDKNSKLKTTYTDSGKEVDFKFFSRMMSSEWERRNGNIIDENDELNFIRMDLIK